MRRTLLIFFAIVLFLIALMFYFLHKKAQSELITSQTMQTQKIEATASAEPILNAQDTVKKLYTTYLDCLKNPPTEAQGQVGKYCQIHSGQFTPDFADRISKSTTDPITCSQNPPKEITITGYNALENGKTLVGIEEDFGSGKTVGATARTLFQNNKWLIDNIACG